MARPQTTKFRIDPIEMALAEAAGTFSGLPGAGSAAALFYKFSAYLIDDTAELRIPVLQPGRYDPLLIQASDFINTQYRLEPRISRNLPYKESYRFRYASEELTVSIWASHEPFRMEPFEDLEIERLRDQGINALKENGKYRHDSETIRLDGFAVADGALQLHISRARYSDQARSNLVLDHSGTNGRSIRKQLRAEYGEKLPPLSDKRLANSIGVAILVFYNDKGRLTPYFVPRTKGVAVFNFGEWHCTASGAAEWPRYPDSTEESFREYVLDDLYNELEEEVGLSSDDLRNVLPLALCREFIRGGKPQLFFIGFTNLSHEELTARMHTAREKADKRPEPVEVHRMPFFRWPPNIDDPDRIVAEFEGGGFSSEAAACLYYSQLFLKDVQSLIVEEMNLARGGKNEL